MKTRSNLTITIVSAFLLAILGFAMVFADYSISIIIDNKSVQSDVPPQLVQNRTLVPLRLISETMGAEVEWIQGDMTVEILTPYQKFLNRYNENGMYIKQADEILEMVNAEEAIVLDVRSDALRSKGYINGSLHIPLPQLVERLEELPEDKSIAVYCAKNINASYAVAILNMMDHDAFLLEDGMNAWLTAGGENTYFST